MVFRKPPFRSGARYLQHDIWMHVSIARGLYVEGCAILDKDLVPEDEFVQSIIYREHLHKIGVARVCAGGIFDMSAQHVLPTLIGTYRGLNEPRFDEANRDRMKLLVPHLSRALGVMYRLRDAELKMAATFAALDRLSSAVVLIGKRGAVIHANRQATRILEEDDGLALSHGKAGPSRLVASDPTVQSAMDRAVSLATSVDLIDVPHFSTAVRVLRRSVRQPLALQFAPLPELNDFREGSDAVSGIVFITEPDAGAAIDAATLHRLFGVSSAEARLAALLCSGRTLSEAAEELAVSQETLKTQLASLFQKTGTNRQAELVRLLLSLNPKSV